MEFAETVLIRIIGTDDSWPPGGAQEFFVGRSDAREREQLCALCC
jgi:hypothetical protein